MRLASLLSVVATAVITAASTVTPSASAANVNALAKITVQGNKIQRGGQSWWLTGYNSYSWSGNCGRPEERMTPAQVDAWFATMRHDGHGAVRLFFFAGWDITALDAAVASAKKHSVYLTITLDDATAGCGESSKTPEWYANAQERTAYQNHMVNLLQRYRGETAIAWFEYLNEPGGDNTWRQVRDFYNAMGDVAAGVDPDRLFSSGTVAPHAVGGEASFRAITGSRGVDVASLHEFDDVMVSDHYAAVKANSAGKPIIVGEYGYYANPNGTDCEHSFDDRADESYEKIQAYVRDSAGAGAFTWAWQPGGPQDACELGNIDTDLNTQAAIREVTK